MPDPKEDKRISPSVGLVINDSAGYERFGPGLKANGSMGMGFDAPPGKGDDRNRGRISGSNASALSDVSTATQEARALSREIGVVLDAAAEVRSL